MFDQLFGRLKEKYGDDFNWSDIRGKEEFFLNELYSELRENHPLHGKAQAALAKCDSKDDVLFLLRNNSYAIVHLTYSKNNVGGFPRYQEFSDLQSAMLHMENEYL